MESSSSSSTRKFPHRQADLLNSSPLSKVVHHNTFVTRALRSRLPIKGCRTMSLTDAIDSEVTLFYGGRAHIIDCFNHNATISDPNLVHSSPAPDKFVLKYQERRDTKGSEYNSGDTEINKAICEKGKVQEFPENDPPLVVSIKGLEDCISYLSLFPADYKFSKDILVWSWIAIGIISHENADKVEETALECFDKLVALKCVELSGYGYLGSHAIHYKLGSEFPRLHDKHKSGLHCMKGLGNATQVADLEHLSFIFEDIDRDRLQILKKFSNLKTLLLHKCNLSNLGDSLDDLLSELKVLKALDLSCTDIQEVPSSVENMQSLVFLDLSNTIITRLPDWLGLLINLETLLLLGCKKLSYIPETLVQLTNLQNLVLGSSLLLSLIPKGVWNMTKLKMWGEFRVGRGEATRIGELGCMNRLKGSLAICGLESISGNEEAKEVRLGDKHYITKLHYMWSSLKEDSVEATQILENLRPHVGLQELSISRYGGSVFPTWISNPSFSEIVSITISWSTCVKLPCLGELPSLEILEIYGMDEVVHIDDLFCRGQENDKQAFPKLEKLSFKAMANLVEWRGVGEGDFPCLVHLVIKSCPKLVSLPCLPRLNSLKHLEMNECGGLPFLLLPASVRTLSLRQCPRLEGELRPLC